MKYSFLTVITAAMLALGLFGGRTLFAQTSVQTLSTDPQSVQTVQTPITSAGTISQFGADTIVVKSDDVAEPVHYTYNKTTTYVDENGNPVSMETVKSGLPVTVYYVRDGDNLIASKVIVRTVVVAPAVNVQDSKTTTTTTTNK